MNSPDLLSSYEHCNRLGYWEQTWHRAKMSDVEMLQAALKVGLTTERDDFGMAAGEECYGFGSDPGLHTKQMDIHSQVVHLSTLSDIMTTAIRKPQEKPWRSPEPIQIGDDIEWHSDIYLDPSGTHLRRIALVSSWNDDRHYRECRSWDSLGNVCVYGLPMQLAVCVIGTSREGKRHSYWTHGLRHPVSKQLRFRKKQDKSTPFKNTWNEVWREDFDEISTKEWLSAMISDEVLKDVFFKVDIPVPEKKAQKTIIDLAKRKLEKISKLKTVPDQQLSTCDWPSVCIFRTPCHRNEDPSSRYGFVKNEELLGIQNL